MTFESWLVKQKDGEQIFKRRLVMNAFVDNILHYTPELAIAASTNGAELRI